jgi:pyrroline-5-carboxylate reductase
MPTLDSISIAFIGAGNMAEAIARALVARSPDAASRLCACDPSPARRELFASQLGIRSFEQASQLDPGVELVILAVKPQSMTEALQACAATFDRCGYLSIAAGIKTASIEAIVGARPVVRAMPNTPLMLGCGATAIAPGAHARTDDLMVARAIFESSGVVVDVREDQMNAVTALSGSGPAYFFLLVEQMVRAGVEMGLAPDVAHALATQTALGAGRMLRESRDSPAELRRKVTSPGGTTQAAVETMQARQMDQAIVDALKRAELRGRELGG